MRRLAWLVLAGVFALGLSACGGKHVRRTSGGHAAASGRGTVVGGHAGTGYGGGSSDDYDDIRRSQGSRYRRSSDSVPEGPPPEVIAKLPEPVPKVEPRALYGNKSPYTVLGQTYRVLPRPAGYVERGIASFYGNKFHGYKTSSLEDYDMYQFTAAHKTLPLPSFARVTNLENGRSVVVRINDRGPFHDNRLIDLSYAAAVRIGIWPKGTGLVEVRAIDPSAPAQSLPPPPAVPPGGAHPGIYLQVGAFSDAANAERVAAQLRQANYAPVLIVAAQINGRSVQRVRVGPLADVDTADEVTAKIEASGLPRPQVAVD